MQVVLDMPVVVQRQGSWSRQFRIAWRCRRCSSCAVVDVAVFMPRQVPGIPGMRFRSVHRQVRDGLKRAFCLIFEAFFALRPAGREGQGGGDAGSLLPGVLPPQLGATVQWYGETHHCNISSAPQPPQASRLTSVAHKCDLCRYPCG